MIVREWLADADRSIESRAQANLPALAVALLVLTGATGLALAVADGAFAAADRDPTERRLAVSLSERLVAGESPLTNRSNVLNGSAVSDLTADTLGEWFPVTDGHAVEIALDGRTLATTGDASGGTTMRRIVLVERRDRRTDRPAFDGTNAITLPRRIDRVDLTLSPASGTTIRTVRANGRVVLHNRSGLDGTYTVALSRLETTRLRFDATGDLSQGDVEVTWYPASTTKAYLRVSVDEY